MCGVTADMSTELDERMWPVDVAVCQRVSGHAGWHMVRAGSRLLEWCGDVVFAYPG